MFGAVSIVGPKWCGKTWTAMNHSNSMMSLAGRTGPYRNRDLVIEDYRTALEGDRPRLIDEWQEVPAVWDDVRMDIDLNPGCGRYVLTGSSVPRRGEYVHSGAGRITKVPMRTMTLYETGDSTGAVSLSGLFEGGLETTDCGAPSYGRLVDLVVRGGWPSNIGRLGDSSSGDIARDYLGIAVEDACRLDGRSRNGAKMRMLVRSLARNESTLASDSTVRKGMQSYDGESIAIETYNEYMDCLDRIHLIEDTPCFRPNVRSSMRVGKMSKRHLTDVSLAAAALGATRESLAGDPETFGLLFEALCEHDLQIYAESRGGRLFHYRDGRDREVDAVVELRDGRWGAFEVKLGFGEVDRAAENLLRIRSLFEAEGCPPSVLCVVCGTSSYAYRRPDGVLVVPITALGPRRPLPNRYHRERPSGPVNEKVLRWSVTIAVVVACAAALWLVVGYYDDGIEVSVEVEGGGEVSGAGTYGAGDRVELTAVADEGYSFEGWYMQGVLILTDPVYSFTVTGDVSLTAVFSQSYVAVSVSVLGCGEASGAGSYGIGEAVELSATPDDGYYFEGWYIDGELVSEDADYGFEAGDSVSLEAVFSLVHGAPFYAWTEGSVLHVSAAYGYSVAGLAVEVSGVTVTSDGSALGVTLQGDADVVVTVTLSDGTSAEYEVSVELRRLGNLGPAGFLAPPL